MFENTLAIVGLILVVILVILTHSVYYSSNVDSNGNTLDCWSTIKNAIGITPMDNLLGTALDKTQDLTNGAKGIVKSGVDSISSINLDNLRKKEVFNIENNEYTYEQAQSVCSAFGAELATYDQLQKAHKKGANWCNYGWSANQMALFPIQKEFYGSLQIGPKELRDSCGKPGINGGFFSDKSLQLGVNCYGYKPNPDPTRIVYNMPADSTGTTDSKKSNIVGLDKNPSKLDKSNIDILPFSNDKWSNYSFKKSTYIIKPKQSKNNTNSIEDKYLEVTNPISELDKDPRKVNYSLDSDINNSIDNIDMSEDTL